MKIKLELNDTLMKELQSHYEQPNTNQVIADAVVLLNWVISEAKKGRMFLTATEDGEDIKEVALPNRVVLSKPD